MFFRTIKFKLTVWYLLVLTVLLLVFSFISYFLLSNLLYQNLDNSLRTRAVEIGSNLTVRAGQIVIREQIGELVLLYDRQGNLLVTSGGELDATTVNTLIDNALSDKEVIVSGYTTDGQQVRLYARRVGTGRLNAIMVVGRSTTETVQALASFRETLLVAIVITIILAGAGGLFVAARALKPVDEITTMARSIEEKDLSRRIEVKTRDELGRLAETLNEMINRLERAFDRQRQFTADASHELRTPLSVIEAEATLALRRQRDPEDYQKALESIMQEVNYMSGVLEKLLMLARADAGKEQLNLKPVKLNELIMSLTPDIEILAGDKGLKYITHIEGEINVEGDEIKLKQLLFNLLDNAIKYTVQGQVSLSLSKGKDHAIIKVEDTGIGISEEHLPHIFERFYRVDKARSRSEHGTGLGLAIAKYIVESHGGSITVTSKPGVGTTFTVYLPLARER